MQLIHLTNDDIQGMLVKPEIAKKTDRDEGGSKTGPAPSFKYG